MPNFQGRYLKQGTSGTYGSESLPNSYTEIAIRKYEFGVGPVASVTGAGTFENNGYPAASNVYSTSNGTSNYPLQKITIDASLASSTYQNNAKVNPDNAEIMYCIKY